MKVEVMFVYRRKKDGRRAPCERYFERPCILS